jgi:isopentenyl-diphosphate delta-isomerase
MEEVILVNEEDQPIGQMEKMEAHQKGLLHRAFSVLIFNSKDQVLLQKRASSKYHSGGLWTNTCCSHPRPGETVLYAANRRLMEEMGMTADLTERFHFIYKTDLDNDLVEHELDHVLVGQSDDLPKLNSDEAEDFKYIDLETLKQELNSSPENYTVWFKIIMEAYFDHQFKVEVA